MDMGCPTDIMLLTNPLCIPVEKGVKSKLLIRALHGLYRVSINSESSVIYISRM